MTDARQVPDSAIADIAIALDRIGMRRPGAGGPRPGAPRHRGHDHDFDGHEHEHSGHPGRPGHPGARRGAMGARRMLHAIVHEEEPRSITDLGRAIGVDQPRASRLVQALADAGLVRRIPDPSDGRRVVIEATKAGRARFEAHAQARAAEVAAAAAALTEGEREQLAELLQKLADAWPTS